MPSIDELLQGLPTGAVLLWANIAPFFLSLFLAAWAVRRAVAPRSAAWSGAVALLASWVAIHLTIWGPPPLPPVMAFDWLMVGVPLAALATLWSVTHGERRHQGVAIQVVAALTLVGITLWPRMRVAEWSGVENVWRGLLYSGAILFAWFGAARGAARRPARESLALMHVVAACSATAIGTGGTQQQGWAAGGVAAALAGLFVAVSMRTDAGARVATGAAPVAAAAIGGLLMNGNLFSEVGLDVALLCLTPLALAGLGGLLWPNRRGLVADLVRVVLIASPAIFGAVLALLRFQAEDTGEPGYY